MNRVWVLAWSLLFAVLLSGVYNCLNQKDRDGLLVRVKALEYKVEEHQSLVAAYWYLDKHNQWYLRYGAHPTLSELNVYEFPDHRLQPYQGQEAPGIYYHRATGQFHIVTKESHIVLRGLPECPTGPPI